MVLKKIAKKKLLVTGAAGYLGGRIVEFLIEKKHFIVVPATRQRSNKSSIEHVENIVAIDWDDQQQVDEVFSELYGIVHLSGLNAQACVDSPDSVLKSELEFTNNIIEHAIKFEVERFVHISTMHVYGPDLQKFINESALTENPHPYASHHIDKERILIANAKDSHTKLAILRLSNGFGRPSNIKNNCWMLVANQLCRQAVEDGRLSLNSAGMQQRDFIPIASLCDAVNLALTSPSLNKDDPVYNLGSNWAPKLFELAELVAQRYYAITSKKISISLVNNDNEGTNQELQYSIAKLKEIGYQAPSQRDIHNEIDELILFCLKHFEAHNA